jgi:hypothetical protein
VSRQDANTSEVVFHYEKAAHHRVIHVDGAFGGPSPNGNFHMALYSERLPLPKSLTHALLPDGTLGEETSRSSRPGVYREVEISALMSLDTLRSVHRWLENHIAQMDALLAAQPGSDGDEPS